MALWTNCVEIFADTSLLTVHVELSADNCMSGLEAHQLIHALFGFKHVCSYDNFSFSHSNLCQNCPNMVQSWIFDLHHTKKKKHTHLIKDNTRNIPFNFAVK
jgi:hypothetical protein